MTAAGSSALDRVVRQRSKSPHCSAETQTARTQSRTRRDAARLFMADNPTEAAVRRGQVPLAVPLPPGICTTPWQVLRCPLRSPEQMRSAQPCHCCAPHSVSPVRLFAIRGEQQFSYGANLRITSSFQPNRSKASTPGMGHQQTTTHRRGKHSFHQIGLVRGQFGNVPEEGWLDWIAKTGFDGWEEASWELPTSIRLSDDAGAKAYAEERVAKARSRGLEILSISAHLQGQALGDEPSAKTLQFLGGEAVAAYAKWRAAGNSPPRTDPFYVPADVAAIAQRPASKALGQRRATGPFRRQAAKPDRARLGFCWLACELLEPLVSVSAASQIARRSRDSRCLSS